MQINFKVYIVTHFGQSLVVALKHITDKGKIIECRSEMHFSDMNAWHTTYECDKKDYNGYIEYHYELAEKGKTVSTDLWGKRIYHIDTQQTKTIFLHDIWQHHPTESKVFDTRAFRSVLFSKLTRYKDPVVENATHFFKVQTPALPAGKLMCMTGSGKIFSDWDAHKPVLMSNEQGLWLAKLDLSQSVFPFEYKFATYDIATKKLEHFEAGPNRILDSIASPEQTHIHTHYAIIHDHAWKGGGVNVQVSSLRSENSWGVGDFLDVDILTDWTKSVDLKMIQLLPIHDTTAHYDRRDSYPYSAVSAFALHPIFLNISSIAKKHRIHIPEKMKKRAMELNALSTLDYDSVIRLKQEAISLLFEKCFPKYEDKQDYQDFFTENKEWLRPYAAFCYLRDKYKTADYHTWEECSVYDEKLILLLTDPTSEQYPQIAIHYFVQYHLHLQLSAAVRKAHKAGIILKGDLPIGVGRYSVETWMLPHLFHMDRQAGAPPDAFTRKGQNWSFPTYNWEAMKKDGYAWWKQRLHHMSRYFDATRIDHVLGFFRIWSIPLHAVEGIFGVFYPAKPIHRKEFEQKGIAFNESRLCQPFIHEQELHQLFQDNIGWVKHHILDGNSFKSHLSSQRSLDAHFNNDPLYPQVRQGLFDILANVILFKDEKDPNSYHFRISIHETSAFQSLSDHEKHLLDQLYVDYFFVRQNDHWYHTAQDKFDAIQHGTDMMLCAEDLGMVPDMVEGVLQNREMLALQVQRMPKRSNQQFSHPFDAPYLSVVTPSTHDMSTLREWWEENREVTDLFYHQQLGQQGETPAFAEPWVCREIISQHLDSRAMWAVFLLQDLMALDEKTRRLLPSEDRINIPADPNHYWNYRMHITLEKLQDTDSLTETLVELMKKSGRA